MESKEIVRWQDAEALRRFQMIAPLVADGVDLAQRVELRKEIALKNDVSERTVRRYEAAYRGNAFEGLKPVSRISGEVCRSALRKNSEPQNTSSSVSCQSRHDTDNAGA